MAIKKIKKKTQKQNVVQPIILERTTYTESELRLKQMMEKVNVKNIGTNSLTLPDNIDARAIQETCIKAAMSQALIDCIACSEAGLAIRGIIPRIDLLDGQMQYTLGWKTKPHKMLPSHGIKFSFRDLFNRQKLGQRIAFKKWTNEERLRIPVFHTDKSVNNDCKVIAFYGAELVGNTLCTDSIEFHRGNVKVISIYDATELTKHQILFESPILYKKHDNCRIIYRVNRDCIGFSDNIRLLGVVCEFIGHQIVG